MLGRLDHVAIAVPDLEAALGPYRALGAAVGPPLDLPEHGVTVAFLQLPNSKLELMQPLGEASPLLGFLRRSPGGGLHHVCFLVEDILAARDRAVAAGLRVLGTGEPRLGAHGRPVVFLHPADLSGTLVELEEG